MKNKFLVILVALTLTLSMVLGILVGCGTPATPKPTTPAATTPGATKPTATTPSATKPTTTVAPTPAKAGEVIKWSDQSTATAGSATWWIEKEFVENVKIASNGRLVIELFPNGAIVSRNETLEAVRTGSVECTTSAWDNDWSGKDPKFLICNMPTQFDTLTSLVWYGYHSPDEPVSPGDKLYNSLYEKWNIKNFIFVNKPPEVNYMANKKLVKPADFKGLTFRGSGWIMDILATPEFGSKPVFIAATADVYSALQTGVIDACESGQAYGNYIGGYADITKYWGFPGMHCLGESAHMMINMDAWKKLPADLQKIVELCTKQNIISTLSYGFVQDAKILPTLVNKGINLIYQSPEMQTQWYKIMLSTIDNVYAKKDPTFKAEAEKALQFNYLIQSYVDLQRPVFDSTYPGKKETIKGIQWQ